MSKNNNDVTDRFAQLRSQTFVKDSKPKISEKEEIIKEPQKEEQKMSKEDIVKEKLKKKEESQEVKKPEKATEEKKKAEEQKSSGSPTSIRITEAQKDALLTIAAKRTLETRKKVTTAELINEAIDMYIKKNKNFLE